MKRIIAVDNEEYLTLGIKTLLSSAGFDVVALCDPLQVMKTIKEAGPFDLLITDVVMPKMTGMELIKLIKEERIQMAVLPMTGLPLDVAAECFAYEGIEHYLMKPFTGAELMAKVNEVLKIAPTPQPLPPDPFG